MIRNRYDCLRCDRAFLSKEALDRHYDRNPDHAERFVIDIHAVEPDATRLPSGEWVETDETVETFMTVADSTPGADDSAAAESSAGSSGEEGAIAGEGAATANAKSAAAGVEMTYDPEAASLVVHGVRDRELDLSQFWDVVDDTLTWSFDGTYHKIQFYKDDER